MLIDFQQTLQNKLTVKSLVQDTKSQIFNDSLLILPLSLLNPLKPGVKSRMKM